MLQIQIQEHPFNGVFFNITWSQQRYLIKIVLRWQRRSSSFASDEIVQYWEPTFLGMWCYKLNARRCFWPFTFMSTESVFVIVCILCCCMLLCSHINDGSFINSTYPQHYLHTVNSQPVHKDSPDKHQDNSSSVSAVTSISSISSTSQCRL